MLPGPYAGAAAMVGVIVLGVILAATAMTAARTEASLRGRVAELIRINARQGAYFQAKLQACESHGAGSGKEDLSHVSAEEKARRLAAGSPEGFDVCARMESADQAVLQSLK